MAEAKKKDENDDIQFSREALTDDDNRVAEEEREKRNKPMPEQFRDDPSKLDGWPPAEDRLPAVMRADTKESNEYKLATLKEVDQDDRDLELAGESGAVARAEVNKAIRENPQLDMNTIQAPPTVAAEAAAEGKGAQSNPVPVLDRDGKPLPPVGGAAVAAARAAAATPAPAPRKR